MKSCSDAVRVPEEHRVVDERARRRASPSSVDDRVRDVVHRDREGRERLREPRAHFGILARDATGRGVVDVGVGQEAGVEQIPVLGVDRARVAHQQVVDLDPIGELTGGKLIGVRASSSPSW